MFILGIVLNVLGVYFNLCWTCMFFCNVIFDCNAYL